MSFLDNMGKTLGHVAVGLNDAAKTVTDVAQSAAQTVSGAAQNAAQTVSDAAQTVTDAASETMGQIKQQRSNTPVKKCPGCGQPLNGLAAVCPLCGYELSSEELGTESSVSDLTKELSKIEGRRYSVLASVSQRVSDRESAQTNERIANTIRNYVIPNSKQAVFELMMLAAGNIDAPIIAKVTRAKRALESDTEYQANTYDLSKPVQLAWLAKFEAAFQKAKVAFGTDADFKKIQDLYDSKMSEIEAEKEKAKSFFQRMW